MVGHCTSAALPTAFPISAIDFAFAENGNTGSEQRGEFWMPETDSGTIATGGSSESNS